MENVCGHVPHTCRHLRAVLWAAQRIYGPALSDPSDNRWIAGVSVVRDRSPAGPAQDGVGGPPFLIQRKTLLRPPTPARRHPGENFCWCSRPLPPPPHLFSATPHPPMLSLLLLLHWGDSWGAKVLLPWWWINAPRSWVEGRRDLFSGPPTPGSHQRLLLVEKPGSRDPPKTCVLIKRHQDSCSSCCLVLLFSRG